MPHRHDRRLWRSRQDHLSGTNRPRGDSRGPIRIAALRTYVASPTVTRCAFSRHRAKLDGERGAWRIAFNVTLSTLWTLPVPANRSLDLSSRFRGCLLGLAVGDAVGTTLEFAVPGKFEPIDAMVGGGPFNLEPGQWTDDTSMALCLASSLVERVGFDARDQMDRYCRWRDDGYLSSTGECFDIGRTVGSALQRYRLTGDPFAGSTDPDTAGNGSIMRLAPVPMFHVHDIEAAEHYAAESSRTTHGAIECVDACRLLARILVRALRGESKAEVLLADADHLALADRIAAIARGNYRGKPAAEIHGTGYVVRSLEAALWAFASMTTFRDAVLAAANLGDDADTTAAICGPIAGAFYGDQGIPATWLRHVAMREDIVLLTDLLYSKNRAAAGACSNGGDTPSFPQPKIR